MTYLCEQIAGSEIELSPTCIGHLWVFRNLQAEEIDALSREALRKKLNKGQALLMRGDPTDEMFLIKGGRIKLSKVLENGTEITLDIRKAGDFLGENMFSEEEGDFLWARFRRTKGAIKLHLLLDHEGYLPTFAMVATGRRHDVTIARKVPLARESIVVMDKGYTVYRLFDYWTTNGIYFVTRLKDNARYTASGCYIPPRNRKILADQIIRLTGPRAKQDCPAALRRIEVWDPEAKRKIVLLTNIHHFGATTISAIYRDRWQIELLFKALKQNLKIKTFVGTSENALLIQIWTASVKKEPGI